MMLLSIMDPDFDSIWMTLPLLYKLFLLFFCGVSLYTVSLSVYALFVLHSFKEEPESEAMGSARSPLATLLHRFTNFRQLHVLALYLFGFCIAMQDSNLFHTLGLPRATDCPTLFTN